MTMVRTQVLLAGTLYCGILAIYLLVVLRYLPFQQINLNQIESISIILSILYLLSSASLEITYSNEDKYEVNNISIILSNAFYYSVLTSQALFYLYMAALIITSLF